MLQPGHVLDLYDDSEGVYLKDGSLLAKYGELRVDPPEKLATLADREFALVVTTKTGEKIRKFAIHTPEALAISTHYFSKTAETLPPRARTIAGTNIARAHLRFGADIPDDLAKIANPDVVGPYYDEADAEREAFSRRAAATPEYTKYALERTLYDDSTLRAFPMDDLASTLRSAQEFKKVSMALPPRDRWVVAIKLARELKRYGKEDPVLSKFAALTPNPAFSAYLGARKEHLKNADDVRQLELIEKLAGVLKGPLVAAAVEQFDLRTGLSHLWDIQVRNPWDTCFTLKEASVQVGEKTVTKEALIKLIDSGKLSGLFNKSMLQDFKKDPLTVFESLPRPTREIIAGMVE